MFCPLALREGLGVPKINGRVLTDKDEPGVVWPAFVCERGHF
jgi:hypothetical protein